MSEILLDVKNVSKSFAKNHVLKDVSFNLAPGEVVGLCGENGAGKSTLMNIIFGMEVIALTGGFDGEIIFDGKPINFKSPLEALANGIGMVHQEFSLIPGFTVAENITLNMEETNSSILSKAFGKRLETIDREANRKKSNDALTRLGVDIDVDANADQMPVGYKQFIEIAREITRENVKLIILDEPTAVLTETEADNLLDAIRIISDKGIAVIFISHRLREILEVCDKVIILRDGEITADRPAADITIKEIAALMIGDEKTEAHAINAEEEKDTRNIDKEDVILSVRNLWVDMPGEAVFDANFDVRRGEILGIAGLAGQGKLAIANGILGTFPCGGDVTYKGESLKLGDTESILAHKIAFVSEDRRGVGLLLDEEIYLNIGFNAMQVQDKFTKKILGMKFIDEEAMKANANDYIDSLQIKCVSAEQDVGQLSGGNQQKVCLAKAFSLAPELLFVSEPTRGIDIGAKKLVLDAIKKVNREENTTVVLISSELAELTEIADRIAVVCEGEVAGILPPNASAEDFGLLMSGESLGKEYAKV